MYSSLREHSLQSKIQTHCAKRFRFGVARVSGLEKKDAPWHLRWFYGVMRKMFGKDFTPAKIQMRLPGLVWGGIVWKLRLAANGLSHCVTFNWGKSAPPRESVVPFE
jgi:hypothetical protein